MGHKYIQTKPEPKGTSPPEFALRLERTRQAFKPKFDYFPDDYVTRRTDQMEEQNQIFQREFGPSCVRKNFIRIMRIVLPHSGMFQFKDGKVDNEHTVKSAICYWIQCEILNEEALTRDNVSVLIDHPAAQHTFQIGRIISPGIEPVYENGKLKEYRIASFNHLYFIEDTAEAINSFIKKWGKPIKPFSVAIGQRQGPTYESNCSYTVYDEEDFIAPGLKDKDARAQQIMDLIGANKKGFIRPNEKNGVERYRTTMKKLTDKGLTASEIEDLDVETLRNILASKKKLVATAAK